MAKITAGILGGFSGKIGNIVGASWKGINTMRTLPASVANPRTTGQVAQRNAFTGVVDAAKQVLVSVVKPLNDRFAVKQSGYNLFISRNIAKFDDQGILTDKGALVFSEGQLGSTPISSTLINNGNEVTIEWQTSTSGKQLATDQLYLVLLDTATGMKMQGAAQVATRADGTATVTFPGMNVTSGYIYLMFRSADGTKVSNTESAFVGF